MLSAVRLTPDLRSIFDSEAPFAEHRDMIEAFTANRADEPFDILGLPRAVLGDRNLFDSHSLDTLGEFAAVDAIVITRPPERTESIPIPYRLLFPFARRAMVEEFVTRPRTRRFSAVSSARCRQSVGVPFLASSPFEMPTNFGRDHLGHRRDIDPDRPFGRFERVELALQ